MLYQPAALLSAFVVAGLSIFETGMFSAPWSSLETSEKGSIQELVSPGMMGNALVPSCL